MAVKKFSNPAIIQNMDDVKLAMVEVPANEMSFYELMDGVRRRLIELITADVDYVVNKGELSREETVAQIATRVHNMLDFFETTEPDTEEELADELMLSKQFDLWKMRAWENFKSLHKGKIEQDTPISSQGVLTMSEDDVNSALNELTLEGVLEVLKNINS